MAPRFEVELLALRAGAMTRVLTWDLTTIEGRHSAFNFSRPSRLDLCQRDLQGFQDGLDEFYPLIRARSSCLLFKFREKLAYRLAVPC